MKKPEGGFEFAVEIEELCLVLPPWPVQKGMKGVKKAPAQFHPVVAVDPGLSNAIPVHTPYIQFPSNAVYELNDGVPHVNNEGTRSRMYLPMGTEVRISTPDHLPMPRKNTLSTVHMAGLREVGLKLKPGIGGMETPFHLGEGARFFLPVENSRLECEQFIGRYEFPAVNKELEQADQFVWWGHYEKLVIVDFRVLDARQPDTRWQGCLKLRTGDDEVLAIKIGCQPHRLSGSPFDYVRAYERLCEHPFKSENRPRLIENYRSEHVGSGACPPKRG